MNYRKDFPIFQTHPELIFLDSTSTSQKPKKVIDGIKKYLETSYSNIHRGMYDIAIESEKLYNDSKKIIANHLGVDIYKEIIYTANSTYAANILAHSLAESSMLQEGDVVLLTEVEHHANIVPWLILKEKIGIKVKFVKVDEYYNLDFEDFKDKYTSAVKLISFTHVSNVTGQIFDLKKVGELKRDDTLFVVDASQSVAHFPVNVDELRCDFLFFTGHKIFADSGIGVLWGKRFYLRQMLAPFSGGGAIADVTTDDYSQAGLPDKFEPGTPNMTGAVSLLRAFEYVESIGGFKKMHEYEQQLVDYFLEKLQTLQGVKLLGGTEREQRVGVFSLYFENHHSHDIAEMLAEKHIAVRAGKHCAHPFFQKIGVPHSVRISLHIYNTFEEIDRLLDELKKL